MTIRERFAAHGRGASRAEPIRRAPDLLLVTILLLIGAAIGITSLIRRPDINSSGQFLFGDQSLNLLLADRLSSGGRLYADVAYQYGPLSAWGYAVFARVAGNTVLSYNVFLLAISLVNLGLAYLLLRRYSGALVSFLIVVFGLTPVLLIPGSLLGGYAVSPYVPLERTVLLVICLLWRPPGLRTVARAAWIGVALGLMQGVKFGGAFFVGAAVILLDLLAARVGEWGKGGLKGWIRSLLVTLAGFLGVQGAWIAYAFADLPPAIARDFLWPSYVLKTYSAWMQPGERWPTWTGWKMFLGQQLTPVLGGVLGLAAIVYLMSAQSRRRAGEDGQWRADLLPLLLPILFYLLATVGYFRQVYHFYQFAWALVIPLAWPIRPRPKALVPLLLLLIPCFVLNARAQVINEPDPALSPLAMPDGTEIWLRSGIKRDLEHFLERRKGGGLEGTVFFALGGGLYHFYGIESPLRQPWLLPGFVRPYDEQSMLRVLPLLRRLVVIRDTDEHPEARTFCRRVGGWNPFSPATCEVLDQRLEAPIEVGENFVVFPVKPS